MVILESPHGDLQNKEHIQPVFLFLLEYQELMLQTVPPENMVVENTNTRGEGGRGPPSHWHFFCLCCPLIHWKKEFPGASVRRRHCGYKQKSSVIFCLSQCHRGPPRLPSPSRHSSPLGLLSVGWLGVFIQGSTPGSSRLLSHRAVWPP